MQDILLLLRIHRLLWQLKPSVALTFTIKCNIYTCLASAFKPISVIPNVSGLGTAFLSEGFLNKLVRGLYQIAFRIPKIVFFQNNDDLKAFQELGLVRTAQARLLPGSGVDINHFALMKLPKNNNDSLTFILMARMLWDKGVGEFARAAVIVKKRFPQASFQLLGFLDVQNRSAIGRDTIDKWEKEGILQYLGSASDVRPFITNADCVVLPSYREGTPRALLEAAAMGRPIVTTNVPGCRDVVENGETGLYCQVKDARNLAEKLEEIIEIGPKKREQMGKAGRKMVEQKYDDKLIVKTYFLAIGGM